MLVRRIKAMSSFDIIGMCIRNLLKRKLRTLLTMLGVIIGTAALVLTISLGLASDARFEQMAEDMDLDMTLITVWPSGMVGWGPDGPTTPEGVPELDDDAVDIILEMPGVVVASPTMGGNIFIRSGPYQMWAWVTGMRAEAIEMMFPLAEGRMIEPGEQNAAVFGAFAEVNFTRPDGRGFDWTESREFRRRWLGEDVETYVNVLSDPILFSIDSRFMWVGMEEEDFDEFARPIPVFNLDVVGVLEESGQQWTGPDFNIYMDIEALRYLTVLRLEAEREADEEWGHFSAINREPGVQFESVIVRVDDPQNSAIVAGMIEDMGFQAHYDGRAIDMMQEM